MDMIYKTLDWKSVNKNVIKMFEFYVKKTVIASIFLWCNVQLHSLDKFQNLLSTLFKVHEHK